MNIPQWHTIAVGITGHHNAGTMWDFSDGGVTCSGRILVTVTGLANHSCKKNVTQDFVHVEFKNKSAKCVQRYVGPAHAVYVNNLY